MSKTRWSSKQYSRYDLTITKIQKLLGLITASGMVATAIALGATFILVVLLVVGFGAIMTLAYMLDKIGFQKATAEELWIQQVSGLWWNQANVAALLYNIYSSLTLAEQEAKLQYFLKQLGIEELYKGLTSDT